MIYYIRFYTFDSGMKVCAPFNCFSKKFSSHEFDFEIVILEINKKSEMICRVCFCSHGLDKYNVSSLKYFYFSFYLCSRLFCVPRNKIFN
jgi:hypothetical protein